MPKIVDRELRREELLEATWRVMARSGIDAVSVRDIATEAGYSTGVVAHYFKNKDDVVRSALLRVWRHEAGRIRQRTAGLKGLAALEAIIEEVLPLDDQRRLEMAVWMSFWGRAIGDGGLSEEQKRYYAQWRGLLSRHLSEAVELGEVGEIDCEKEAACLAGVIDGIGIQAIFEPGRFKARALLAMVHDHLARLASPGGSC
ncbi:MAG: TetR/AcrR family transcriptional regulator [Acidimicrobiales bacterium]